jgi:hypothetical protein
MKKDPLAPSKQDFSGGFSQPFWTQYRKEHPATDWMQLNLQPITLLDGISWLLFINFTVSFKSEQ